jgi:hypothetical protein
MSISDLVWLSIGELLLAATFALGILVGASLRRKESLNDDGNSKAAKNNWNYDLAIDTPRPAQRRACGRACPQPEADPHERLDPRRAADRE